jgi:hypothetical protein
MTAIPLLQELKSARKSAMRNAVYYASIGKYEDAKIWNKRVTELSAEIRALILGMHID